MAWIVRILRSYLDEIYDKKIEFMKGNVTWMLESLPNKKRHIRLKWGFKLKMH